MLRNPYTPPPSKVHTHVSEVPQCNLRVLNAAVHTHVHDDRFQSVKVLRPEEDGVPRVGQSRAS